MRPSTGVQLLRFVSPDVISFRWHALLRSTRDRATGCPTGCLRESPGGRICSEYASGCSRIAFIRVVTVGWVVPSPLYAFFGAGSTPIRASHWHVPAIISPVIIGVAGREVTVGDLLACAREFRQRSLWLRGSRRKRAKSSGLVP